MHAEQEADQILLDYDENYEEKEEAKGSVTAKPAICYDGVHTTCFKDFLLKP